MKYYEATESMRISTQSLLLKKLSLIPLCVPKGALFTKREITTILLGKYEKVFDDFLEKGLLKQVEVSQSETYIRFGFRFYKGVDIRLNPLKSKNDKVIIRSITHHKADYHE